MHQWLDWDGGGEERSSSRGGGGGERSSQHWKKGWSTAQQKFGILNFHFDQILTISRPFEDAVVFIKASAWLFENGVVSK